MSTYVALICNLEQIWPYCDPKGTANGWVLVGINWSVSIGSDTPDGFKDIVGDPAGPGDFTAIEPWMWPEITAIQVLPNLNGTALCVPAVCPPRPCNPKLLSDKLDARLHAEFWNGREKAAALQFSPRQGPASDKLTYHNALA